MFVLAAYELYCLLSYGGTAVCSRTAVCDGGNEGGTDTLDIDTVVLTETLVLDGDDRVIQVGILDIAVGYIDPVDVL